MKSCKFFLLIARRKPIQIRLIAIPFGLQGTRGGLRNHPSGQIRGFRGSRNHPAGQIGGRGGLR
ncbi:MAG: hypothetical protein ACFNWZ_04980, partial [Candidatus Absconditicoccaceae bacterium]